MNTGLAIETNIMKTDDINLTALSVLNALSYAPACALAAGNPLVGLALQNVIVCSNTYTTAGADSAVYGNVVVSDGTTTGANAAVTTNVLPVAASSTGLGGAIKSRRLAPVGEGGRVAQGITSGNAASIGAGSQVFHDVGAVGLTSTDARGTVGLQTRLLNSLMDSSCVAGLAMASTAHALLVDQTQAWRSSMGLATVLSTAKASDTSLRVDVSRATNFSMTAGAPK